MAFSIFLYVFFFFTTAFSIHFVFRVRVRVRVLREISYIILFFSNLGVIRVPRDIITRTILLSSAELLLPSLLRPRVKK